MKIAKAGEIDCPNGYPGENMKCCRCVRPQYPIESKKIHYKKDEWEEAMRQQREEFTNKIKEIEKVLFTENGFLREDGNIAADVLQTLQDE